MTLSAKNILGQEHDHSEGPVAKTIEEQTARLPSDLFLWAAVGSIAASAFFQLRGRKQTSNFIGQWAPTILILGLYNKLVKVAGSDQYSQ
jgi:hypothetical protein